MQFFSVSTKKLNREGNYRDNKKVGENEKSMYHIMVIVHNIATPMYKFKNYSTAADNLYLSTPKYIQRMEFALHLPTWANGYQIPFRPRVRNPNRLVIIKLGLKTQR